jgi:hypothetical protein
VRPWDYSSPVSIASFACVSLCLCRTLFQKDAREMMSRVSQMGQNPGLVHLERIYGTGSKDFDFQK